VEFTRGVAEVRRGAVLDEGFRCICPGMSLGLLGEWMGWVKMEFRFTLGGGAVVINKGGFSPEWRPRPSTSPAWARLVSYRGDTRAIREVVAWRAPLAIPGWRWVFSQ
jgi:hypothetical protein